MIEAGDQADFSIQQGSADAGEIIGTDEGIAVRHDERVVPGALQHVDETADLAIVTVLLRIDDDIDREIGKLRHQACHDRERRIALIPYAEDDLELGIILQAKGTQVLVQARFRATQGLEHGHGRGA